MKFNYLIPVLLSWCSVSFSADLLSVYQQAQISDPVFQQAVASRLANKEGVPISVATLLPTIDVSARPYVSRIGFSGSNFQPAVNQGSAPLNPRNLTDRGYTLSLSATQTIFNFAQFSSVAQQLSLSKAADATLNAELQNLMMRVARAYFAILRDEDNLSYALASKRAYQQQLNQVQQQYKVGIKTITDVYTAQAAYDSAEATRIAAETTLANDKENLRAMTGVYYDTIEPLSERFPLMRPQPERVDTWVNNALQNNWSLKASQYNTGAARQVVRQQFAGHLPTVSAQTTFTRDYSNNINNYASFTERNGPGTTSNRTLAFNLDFPIFSGGGVVAKTKQASYQYQVAQQQQEEAARNTANATRQYYLNVVAGISQIKADQEAIKSSNSALKGLEASYNVGTETLVDVLNQQQKVFQAQTQYATDRYAYVENFLALKQAAGTLSISDLRALNEWLGKTHKTA